MSAAAQPAAAAPHVASSSAGAEEVEEEDEGETLPLLARRVMAGRQSIVPHHKVLMQGKTTLIHSEY